MKMNFLNVGNSKIANVIINSNTSHPHLHIRTHTSKYAPRALSDWLMFVASSKALPDTPDLLTRSLPARSTMNSVGPFFPSASDRVTSMIA